ncbi:hypothetical protein Tb927.7.2430 [Trypanosoma brucei brucei TREU927]|uniref:T. brucei spp.-specific protein n=1 Tax=Trypanosoma brucei brucei (strain 927/4 GUTat10.1) TaxID=185431 RepID=Q57XN1_TRYB2|nr:hypothetical protein Tb927.7.2430 [Trypanosoma brucei brucei TREU927]AAX69637.1 hypothetical protein Tb927.7.2430 [Trypanosoma brucei]AAZ12307.1 hypothetical protein Tb927.7.2430 [Trypanosoma brucei brucei TREU927]
MTVWLETAWAAQKEKKRCANNSRCCFFFMLSNLSQILWEFVCRSIFSPRCSPIEMYRNAFYMSLLLKSSSFFSFFLLFSFVASLASSFFLFLFWFSCLCDLSPLRNCFLLVLTVIYPVPSTKKTPPTYIYIYIYISITIKYQKGSSNKRDSSPLKGLYIYIYICFRGIERITQKKNKGELRQIRGLSRKQREQKKKK